MNALRLAGAATYAGIGATGLLAPERIPAHFGGAAPTPAARNEIRAVYGGLPVVIALMAVRGGRSARTAALLSAGMAAGRAYGVSQEEEPPDDRTRTWIGIESALAASLLLGSGRGRKRASLVSP